MSQPWVSVEEVARHLGVAKDTVYRWIETKSLPAHRVGRLWKLQLDEVDEWVRWTRWTSGYAVGAQQMTSSIGSVAMTSAALVLLPAAPSLVPAAPKGLRPFFGYYGGKWRDAQKHYPRPAHATIVEPFAGSAGYSLRYPDRNVVLCEIDPILVGVWNYLTTVSPKEILKIPDVAPDSTVDELDLPQEAKWLVGFWLNRGIARPCKSPSKWMREGARPGSFWGERVRQTIARQLDSIRHWKIVQCSYADCPISEPATWFVDPPYQVAGQHYRFGSDEIDFQHLGQWCRSRPGQVIACENAGADWLPFRDLGDIKTTRTGRRSREVIWTREGSE